MRIFFCLILTFVVLPIFAQEGQSVFEYLLLPQSARQSALGGINVSTIENDASIIYNNPALLGSEMDLTLNVSYLSYIANIGIGNVVFTKTIGKQSAWGIGALYANYGQMWQTNEYNYITDKLMANDICGSLFFSHDLTAYLRGGITGKLLYSNLDYNTAIGLGVDIGLSYYIENSGFSWGVVGKNIGRQIKAYEEELSNLPWDIQAGISQKLNHAPICFSITGISLRQWKSDNIDKKKDSFIQTFGKHFIIGVDIIPSENFWIGLGYNIKRGIDMHLQEGNRLGGFSVGTGFRTKTFGVGCSIGKYNTAATSLMVSLSTSLASYKL